MTDPLPVLAFPELGYHGRLGNQLWQVASTVGLARANNTDPRFPAAWDYRAVLSCPDEWFDDDALAGAMTSPELAARVIGDWPATYLQHLAFVEHAADEVRRAFQPNDGARPLLGEYLVSTGVADLAGPRGVFHCRRGDTVNNPAGTLNPINPAWFRRAVRWLRDGAASVVAVTDDADWVREHLGDEVDIIVSGAQRPPRQEGGYDETGPVDWLDLYLISTCDRVVIGNSSYSWWGAWLAGHDNIAYPSPWFGPAMRGRHRRNRFLPANWTALQGATPEH